MNPLVTFPDQSVALPPRYFGSIAYYAAAARYGRPAINAAYRYDKREKEVHRTTIADVNGPLRLTVPVSRPDSTITGILTWSDIRLSEHGEWWNIHRTAIESAYGRTPYFEFYIDRFLPALTPGVCERFNSVLSLDNFVDNAIRSILNLPSLITPDEKSAPLTIIDPPSYPSYYQVRQDRLGFIGGLSILDLLFNLGPEAQRYLKTLNDKIYQSVSRY